MPQMANFKHAKKNQEDDEPEREDQEASDAFESKDASEEEFQGSSVFDSDYDEVKEAETDQSSDEESVKPSRIRQRRTTAVRRGRAFSSDDESTDFSDDSLSYDSDDSDLSSSGLGRCCSCIGTIVRETYAKTLRNGKGILYALQVVARRALIVARSEELHRFLVNLLMFLHFLVRFIWSLLMDLKNFVFRKLDALWTAFCALFLVVLKYLLVALRFSVKEGFRLSVIAFVEGKKQAIVTVRRTKAAGIFCVRSPYLLGKTIVNAPWILYKAFLENTNLLIPMLYGFIGWCIVLFLYIPIFAYILHCVDVLTVEDLDALGLKGLCISLGLIPEEKKSSFDVLRKVWRQIFY